MDENTEPNSQLDNRITHNCYDTVAKSFVLKYSQIANYQF